MPRNPVRTASGQVAGAVLEAQGAALKQSTDRLKRLDDMWLDGLVTDQARYREREERELARKREITLANDRIGSEADRMRTNLERGTKFLAAARSEMAVAGDRRKKEICRALATDYRSDGTQKTVKIEVHSLQREMVTYAREMDRLEPRITASQSKKKNLLARSQFFLVERNVARSNRR